MYRAVCLCVFVFLMKNRVEDIYQDRGTTKEKWQVSCLWGAFVSGRKALYRITAYSMAVSSLLCPCSYVYLIVTGLCSVILLNTRNKMTVSVCLPFYRSICHSICYSIKVCIICPILLHSLFVLVLVRTSGILTLANSRKSKLNKIKQNFYLYWNVIILGLGSD